MKMHNRARFAALLPVLLHYGLAAAEVSESPRYNGSTVIEEAQILSFNVPMLVDLLNRLPGVKASDGFVSLQGSTTNEVLVLLDGRPLTDALTGKANLGGILTSQILRIEIIKGAGSALYGDNTSGGVILITTKKTDSSSVNKLDAAYGTFNTRRFNMNVGRSNNGTGASLSGSYERTDGHRPNDDAESKSARLDLNHRFGPDFDGTLSANVSRDDEGSPGKTTSPTPNARKQKEVAGTSLQLAYRNLKGRAYYNTNDEYSQNPDTGLDTYLETETAGGDLRYRGDTPLLGNALVGLSAENRRAKATNIGNRTEALYGAYVVKSFSLASPGVDVKAGFRGNYHTEFGASYNPELGIGYDAGTYKVDVKASRSSKAPTLRQRYYESTTLQGNPDLKMESATNFQAGFVSGKASALHYGLNLFYSKIDDGISGYYNASGIYTYDNVSASTRKGFECSFGWKISRWLRWDASYIYLLFKNDATDLYLPGKPKKKARTDLYASYGQWKGNFGIAYVGESYNDAANTQLLKSYAVADAKLSYGYRGMEFYVEGENLFDREYEVHLGYPSAGRAWMFGIEYTF